MFTEENAFRVLVLLSTGLKGSVEEVGISRRLDIEPKEVSEIMAAIKGCSFLKLDYTPTDRIRRLDFLRGTPGAHNVTFDHVSRPRKTVFTFGNSELSSVEEGPEAVLQIARKKEQYKAQARKQGLPFLDFIDKEYGCLQREAAAFLAQRQQVEIE